MPCVALTNHTFATGVASRSRCATESDVHCGQPHPRHHKRTNAATRGCVYKTGHGPHPSGVHFNSRGESVWVKTDVELGLGYGRHGAKVVCANGGGGPGFAIVLRVSAAPSSCELIACNRCSGVVCSVCITLVLTMKRSKR